MRLGYIVQILLLPGFLIPVPVSLSGPESGKLSPESHNVYSAVIDSLFGAYDETDIVLSDSTMPDFFYSDLRVKYQHDSLYLQGMFSSFRDSSLEELLNDYDFRNVTKYKIDSGKLATTKKLIFLNRKKFQRYFEQGSVSRGWKEFYRAYPHSAGYVKFTKVGFNRTGTKALLYMEKYCGGTCGAGIYLILEKEKDIWKIIFKREVWVS